MLRQDIPCKRDQNRRGIRDESGKEKTSRTAEQNEVYLHRTQPSSLGTHTFIQFDHPFIIQIVNAFQTEHKFYFILEYCPGGELYNLLAIKEKFSEEQ